ncbi:MAG TPA: hypothetical protein VGC88_06460 [Terriglobales bacterium]
MKGITGILGALAAQEAKFIFVGGVASFLHGSTYPTEDLDLCIERSAENLKKIAAALKPFHPALRGLPQGLKAPVDEQTLKQGTNFTLVTSEGLVDLLGEMSGVGGYYDIESNARVENVNGVFCLVASLEDIIKSKEAANRPKDQLTLPELRALLEMKKQIQKSQD